MARDIQVTRSLLIGSTPEGGRLAEEKRILSEQFPSFLIMETSNPGSWAFAKGQLKTFTGRSYSLWIDLPASYPHSLPAVLPDGWQPTSNPHIYANGALCIMREQQWSSFMSVALVVAKSALWLNKYEIWLDKRIWPGAEQHKHTLWYDVKKTWHGL